MIEPAKPGHDQINGHDNTAAPGAGEAFSIMTAPQTAAARDATSNARISLNVKFEADIAFEVQRRVGPGDTTDAATRIITPEMVAKAKARAA